MHGEQSAFKCTSERVACTVARSAGIAARLKKRVPLTLPCDLKDRPHSHDE
jgi:hypothetical protein